ncbi:MAG: PEP-CTERM sorting domain-containing protein [Phycisphaerae bacterium]
MRKITLAAAIAVSLAAIPSAQAGLIISGLQSEYTPVPGASLSDVRMEVDLWVAGGVATFTFTNVSLAPETTAVFKEIVIDTYNDDTHTAYLTGPGTVIAPSGVAYTIGDSNGLPGFNSDTTDPHPLKELQAVQPPPKNGIGIGQSVQVRFDTTLATGTTIYDYLALFNGPTDTLHGTFGFQAINCSVINGQSLSGIEAPEPATIVLLMLGGLVVAFKRTRRRV